MGEGVPARRTGPNAESDSFLAHQCAEHNGENRGDWDKCPTCGLSKGLTNSDVNLQNLSQITFTSAIYDRKNGFAKLSALQIEGNFIDIPQSSGQIGFRTDLVCPCGL